MTTYNITYFVKANDKIVMVKDFNGMDVFTGFNEMKAETKKLNGTLYRKVTKIELRDMEVFGNGIFVKA